MDNAPRHVVCEGPCVHCGAGDDEWCEWPCPCSEEALIEEGQSIG